MQTQNPNVRRIGAVVGIRPDSIETYRRLHADPWPEVTAENARAGISNYSIFLFREQNLLFSYYEYAGTDRAADAARMAANPVMQDWWKLCRPCQVPLVEGPGARRWADMEPIFYQP
jgi:L-rhamnose mutarotase